MKNTIIENRYIGKIQLTADDMGGVGCKNWETYRVICDKLAVEAYNHAVGRSVDNTLIGTCIAGLFDFFGIQVTDSSAYHARILAIMVERKAQYSDAYKNARKDKNAAKKALDEAIAKELPEDEVEELREKFDELKATLEALALEPHNYWFDPVPMLDKSKKHATAKARKALEDTCADILTERQFMSAEELQAEAQRLADERKGRKMRKKAEAKAEANA